MTNQGRIALKKEIFDFLQKEFRYVGLVFFIALISFKIIFFKESFGTVVIFVLSLFWIFVIPGYFSMLFWKDKIGFTERLVVGVAFSAAIIAILSYYLGLLGVNIKYHTVILPLVLIILGGFFGLKSEDR